MAAKATGPSDRNQPEASEQQPAKPRRLPWATVTVVAGVLLLEIGAVLLVMWFSRGPASVIGGVATDPVPSRADEVEELLLEGKAANTKRGVTYVYRFKIHGVVAKQDLAAIRTVMGMRKATLEDTVRQVVARLEPKDLDEEPELATLRRVLMHEFEQIFGPDKIRHLLLPEWARVRVD